MLCRERSTPCFVPSGIGDKCFSKKSHVCRARSVSTSDRRRLLASPHLAQRTARCQTITRRGDVAVEIGKEGHRLPPQVAGAGGLLAKANHHSPVTSRDGS